MSPFRADPGSSVRQMHGLALTSRRKLPSIRGSSLVARRAWTALEPKLMQHGGHPVCRLKSRGMAGGAEL